MTYLLLAGSLGDQLDALFASFDYSIFQFFGSIQNDILTFIAKCFTSLGSEVFVILFALMGAIMILFKRTRKIGFTIVFAVIIGTLVTNVLVKPLVLRIRPYNTLQSDASFWSWYVGAGMMSESDYCFPSGHTTGVTEIAVALLICHVKSKHKSAAAVCWIFPLIAICVGISRVYLMVHYATDIIAGFIIGAIAGICGYLLSCLVCRLTHFEEKHGSLMYVHVRPMAIVAITLSVVLMFLLAASYVRSTGGADAIRCSYEGEYKCQNEAEDSDKYPPIDGKYYCKMHWKQLNQGN